MKFTYLLFSTVFVLFCSCKKMDMENENEVPKINEGTMFFCPATSGNESGSASLYYFKEGVFKESYINYNKALDYKLLSEQTLRIKTVFDDATTDYTLANSIPIEYDDASMRMLNDKFQFSGFWTIKYNYSSFGKYIFAINSDNMTAKIYNPETKKLYVRKFEFNYNTTYFAPGNPEITIDTLSIESGRPEKWVLSGVSSYADGSYSKSLSIFVTAFPSNEAKFSGFSSVTLVDDKRR